MTFLNIPGSDEWTNIQAVRSGWSRDQKYQFTLNHRIFLLRLSDGAFTDVRRKQYQLLRRLDGLSNEISKVISFGLCDDGKKCYMIMTWIDGQRMEEALPQRSVTAQYQLGLQAGHLLKAIHAISAPPDQPSWATFYRQKINRKLDAYQRCPIRLDAVDQAARFVGQQRQLLSDRPLVLQHGDYHCGNLVITPKCTVGVIDFDRTDFGDPWEEFNRITWCASVSPAFARGRIDGYFSGHVPPDFFPLMALYIATNVVSSLPWALNHGKKEIETIKNEIRRITKNYDNWQTFIPEWYHR